jgi:tetrahydromethanopterin S-methyltransferase subunit B
MTTKTARILNAVIGISGLIHISGIIPNFEYNFQVGLAMIVLAVISFLFNIFAT